MRSLVGSSARSLGSHGFVGEGVFGFDLGSAIGGLGSSVGGTLAAVCGADLSKCGRSPAPPINCDVFLAEVDRIVASFLASGTDLRYYRSQFKQPAPGPCDGEVYRRIDAGIARQSGMGFLDVLNGIGTTIGQTIGSVVGAIPTIVQTVGAVTTGINQVQAILNGGSSGGAVAMGGVTMPMQAPASSMVNGNTNTAGVMAFQQACSADPACTAAIVAALQGGQMPAMMNGSSGMNEDAMLAALGFPPALIMQLRMIPGAIARVLGSVPGQLAVGVAGGLAGTALGTAVAGMGTGMRLPRRIQVPDGRGGVREYVSRGRPVLYSGDLSSVRRVRKVAQRIPRTRRVRRPLMITAGTANVCGKCLTAPCGCNGR